MLDRLFALEVFGIKLGLDNISRLCAALDHPERSFVSLHVAGTNGKGSATAMAHAALQAAGLRAARYTSPHLADLRERFVIGAEPVADAVLEAVATIVLDHADALVASGILQAPPTFFEATTAIAFELFRRAGVQAAVLEVGLGGRFDATNVVSPPVGAITSIGLDHQQQLGESLASIAFEKAGIIKPGMTAVVGALPIEADMVIQQVAEERRARLVHAHEDVRLQTEMADGRATIALRTPVHDYGRVTLGLRGEHQVGNAVVAARLLEAARLSGLAIPFEAIARGLAEVEWPARLERIALAHGASVLLDSAHNPDGAAALARYLRRWHPERPPLVFGVMRDKDIDGLLRALLPAVGAVVLTAAPTPRAEDPRVLAERLRALEAGRAAIVEPDPLRAVERALERAPLVCVAGSIVLAGAVRGPLHGRAILR